MTASTTPIPSEAARLAAEAKQRAMILVGEAGNEDDRVFNAEKAALYAAIDALAALASPGVQQEPVAKIEDGALIWSKLPKGSDALVYAGPTLQARVPLTEERKLAMWHTTTFRGNGGQMDWYMQGIEEAERAHGITAAPGAASLATKEKP